MDVERKINLGEGVPLNSAGAANIFLNTGKKNINDGTVIHLKTGDFQFQVIISFSSIINVKSKLFIIFLEKPTDVGVHINTTFSIASSKKIKLLFLFNFLLSIICMVLSSSIAFYYWNEMISMRKHMDVLKEQFLIQTLKDGVLEPKPEQSPLVSNLRPQSKGAESREGRMDSRKNELSPNARRYYVEDLGEDMLLVDSSKKNASQDKEPVYNISDFQKGMCHISFKVTLPIIISSIT